VRRQLSLRPAEEVAAVAAGEEPAAGRAVLAAPVVRVAPADREVPVQVRVLAPALGQGPPDPVALALAVRASVTSHPSRAT